MPEHVIKIAHILEGFLGGTSTYISTVLPQLVKEGFDVTLICSLDRCCPDAQTRLSELEKSGIKLCIVPMSREINLLKDIRSLTIIMRVLLQQKFDVIHTHSSKAGALGRILAVFTGVRVAVHSPHCFAFLRCNGRMRKKLYHVFERFLGLFTTKLLAVSQSEASAAIQSHIVCRKRCQYIKNALSNGYPFDHRKKTVSALDAKKTLGFDKGTPIVTTACRLVEYKGVFRFLEAAKLSSMNNTVFLIAGEGPLRCEIETFVQENNLNDKVRLLGHVSDMERLYLASDVVVLCSDAESQPYVLLEAMRVGCPIVATSVIGNRELISHRKTGLLVETHPESIAQGIDELLVDENKRLKYAENAYAYFHKHHLLEKQISKLTETYRSCMGL